MVGSLLYRGKQLWWAVTARPLSDVEQTLVDLHLSVAERALFGRFSLNDQQHSLRVFHRLYDAGHHDPDLLTCALLHDIGKTAVGLTVIDRCLVVLGGWLAPKRALQWGGVGKMLSAEAAVGWRKPFVVKQQHPVWSAQMAADAGSSLLAVDLIRQHQAIIPSADPLQTAHLLRLHQAADNLS